MAISGTYESGGSGYVFTGTGTPGDAVVVTVNGSQVGPTGVVEADGSWSIGPVGGSLNPGDVIVAHGGSASGPSSGSLSPVAPGGGATAAGTQPVVAGGSTVITVSGNPGETIVIVNGSTGEVLGTAVVQANGQAAVVLDTPVAAGETIRVLSNGIQEDSITVGGSGPAPVVYQGAVLVEGSVLTGTGVPGALIQVVDTAGHVLGSTTVLPDGTWSVAVSGAVAGVPVKVVQDGVAVDLPSPAGTLGNEKAFTSSNVFKPLLGGSLDIGFKANDDDRITVKVFNVAGETVRVVAFMDVKAGVLYGLKWDGKNDYQENVAAGLYVISINGGKTHVLKKVVVLK